MKVIAVVVMLLVALADLGLAGQREKYCGRRLEKKLFDLCGGIYNKRDGAMDLELSDDGGMEMQDPFFVPSILQAVMAGGGVRQRRGIVEECCKRGCSDWELSLYCKDR